MTGNEIFNYVRRNRNRLNYRRKNCKYLLEKVQAQVESYNNLLLFSPCLSQISPAILAWLPQKRLHGRIMFSNIEHQRKTKKKQNCFNRFRSLSSTYYFFTWRTTVMIFWFCKYNTLYYSFVTTIWNLQINELFYPYIVFPMKMLQANWKIINCIYFLPSDITEIFPCETYNCWNISHLKSF